VSEIALPPAAYAFDAIAERFDDRYGAWLSVAAQRRAVRRALLRLFDVGASILELGGGTGEDASFLVEHGRRVLLTDPSPTMVRLAGAKLRPLGAPEPKVLPAEWLGELASARSAERAPLFDGAFSNFAGLNCVTDLRPMGEALTRLVRPGGAVALVVFGTCAPGEWVVELLRGRPRNAFRRMSRGDVAARLGGQQFTVRYHREAELRDAMAPGFRLRAKVGIGVFVPPSAAEPWISRFPRVIGGMERADRLVERSLAALGDHVLYEFERLG
jgi:SAM-dependent methyltransferase